MWMRIVTEINVKCHTHPRCVLDDPLMILASCLPTPTLILYYNLKISTRYSRLTLVASRNEPKEISVRC